jgi:integrase
MKIIRAEDAERLLAALDDADRLLAVATMIGLTVDEIRRLGPGDVLCDADGKVIL